MAMSRDMDEAFNVSKREREVCARKRTYTSERSAKKAAKEHRKSKAHGQTKWKHYMCPVCGRWHLTTSEQYA